MTGRMRLRGATSGGLGRLGTAYSYGYPPGVQEDELEDFGRPLPAHERVSRQQMVYEHATSGHAAPVTRCPLCAQRGVPMSMTFDQAAVFVRLAVETSPDSLLVEDGGYDQEESYVEHHSVDEAALAMMVLTAYRAGRRDGWAMSRYRRIQRLRRAAR